MTMFHIIAGKILVYFVYETYAVFFKIITIFKFCVTSDIRSASRLGETASVGVKVSVSQTPLKSQPSTASVDDVDVGGVALVQTTTGVVETEEWQSGVQPRDATKVV